MLTLVEDSNPLAATREQVQQHGVVCHQPDTLASHMNDKPNHTMDCKKDDLVSTKAIEVACWALVN